VLFGIVLLLYRLRYGCVALFFYWRVGCCYGGGGDKSAMAKKAATNIPLIQNEMSNQNGQRVFFFFRLNSIRLKDERDGYKKKCACQATLCILVRDGPTYRFCDAFLWVAVWAYVFV